MTRKKTDLNTHPPDNGKDGAPDRVIESLARRALLLIRVYYESEEGQWAFAGWKVQKEKEEQEWFR